MKNTTCFGFFTSWYDLVFPIPIFREPSKVTSTVHKQLKHKNPKQFLPLLSTIANWVVHRTKIISAANQVKISDHFAVVQH